METQFQVICDKCLRTVGVDGDGPLAGDSCGQCGGTWLGPYAVARRFAPREGLRLVVANQYVAAYARPDELSAG